MDPADWTVEYYETVDGVSVVEQEMEAFGSKVFARIARTVGLLEEFGIGLGGPYVSHIRGKVWELRVSRYRVLYFAFTGRRLVLLRAFLKRTQRTPQKEITVAEARLNDYTVRHPQHGLGEEVNR